MKTMFTTKTEETEYTKSTTSIEVVGTDVIIEEFTYNKTTNRCINYSRAIVECSCYRDAINEYYNITEEESNESN